MNNIKIKEMFELFNKNKLKYHKLKKLHQVSMSLDFMRNNLIETTQTTLDTSKIINDIKNI